MTTDDLLGDWHVLFSNFPMWLKGDRSAPRFHYAPHPEPGKLVDIVSYGKAGRRRTIRGIDRQTGERDFTWRGSGLLGLFGSRWRVEHLDPERQWAIIAFERSLVSPAGHDIIGRQRWPDDGSRRCMLATFALRFPGVAIEAVAS